MQTCDKRWSIDVERMVKAADTFFMIDERSCSEALLKAGCEAIGIAGDWLPDIALGLGGGIGLQGHVCGAVSGAALVISLAMANKVPAYAARRMPTHEAAGRVCKELERRFGSLQCRQICGLDLTQPEGIQKLFGGVKTEKCADFVREAARVLAEELHRIDVG